MHNGSNTMASELINVRVHYFKAGDFVDDDLYQLYLVGDTTTGDIEPYLKNDGWIGDWFTATEPCVAFTFDAIYTGSHDEPEEYAGMIHYHMSECDTLSAFENDLPTIKRLADAQRGE